jgi:hypothetical protein
MGLKLPPNVGKVDVLTPVARVRKVRKYREDDREDSDLFSEDDASEEASSEDQSSAHDPDGDENETLQEGQYPHIDDYA